MPGHTPRGAAAVVLADGALTSFDDSDTEVSRPLAGRFVVSWTLDQLMRIPGLVCTVLVARAEDIGHAENRRREAPDLDIQIIEASLTRQASTHKALGHLAGDIRSGAIDVVVVHEAARPLWRSELMIQTVAAAREVGCAVPVLDGDDIMQVRPDGTLASLEQGHRFLRVQTPQAFRALPLLEAYEAAARVGFEDEDPYATVQRFSDLAVHLLPGAQRNLRVESADDLFEAEHLLVASNDR